MSELLRSYRSLPTVPKLLVGAATVLVALALIVNIPHLLGALFGLVFGLVFLAAVAAVFGLVVYALVRAVSPRN